MGQSHHSANLPLGEHRDVRGAGTHVDHEHQSRHAAVIVGRHMQHLGGRRGHRLSDGRPFGDNLRWAPRLEGQYPHRVLQINALKEFIAEVVGQGVRVLQILTQRCLHPLCFGWFENGHGDAAKDLATRCMLAT